VKKLLAISVAAASLLALPFAYAQEREAGPFGGYSIGFGGTRVSAADAAKPAPRLPDGKPDLSGLWLIQGGYVGNIARDLKPEDVSFQPWAAELYAHRRETLSKDDPTGRCMVGGVPRSTVVPYPFKIINTNGMVVILYEAVHSYRQIFTDGRELPKDPNPQWFGYSVGRWQDDTFIAESAGFNDNVNIFCANHVVTFQ
jgi:hypothetical protein